MNTSSDLPDLAIHGVGTRKIQQLPLESWQYLQESDVIILAMFDPIASDVLRNTFDARIIDYSGRYTFDDEDEHTNIFFEQIITPLEHAAQTDGVVSMISDGHPTFCAFITQVLKPIGEQHWGLDVEYFSGITASAEVYSILNIDPIYTGVFEYRFPTAYKENLELNPDVTFTGWLFGTHTLGEQYSVEDVQQYLQQYYDQDRELVFVYASETPFTDPSVIRTTVRDLPSYSEDELRGMTLVIPGDSPESSNAFLNHQASEEQRAALLSGTPRERNEQLDVSSTPVLQSKNKTDLLEVLTRAYTDASFVRELQDDPETALEPYDIDDDITALFDDRTSAKNSALTRGISRLIVEPDDQ